MSDNIRLVVPSKETKKQPTSVRRWMVFIIIFLTVVLLLSLFLLSNSTSLDGIKRFFRYFGVDRDIYGNISFGSNSPKVLAVLDDRLVTCSDDTLTVYSEEGELAKEHSIAFASPAMKAQDGCILAYDIGGKQLVVVSKDGTLEQTLKMDNQIYDAGIAEDGTVCVLTKGSDCHAVLAVYSHEGELLFRRNTKSGYPNRCAISPEGRQVVMTNMKQKDATFYCSAQIFNTDEKDIYAELSLKEQIIYDMFFLNDETVCAVGEKSIIFFNTEGTLVNEYASERGELVGYCYSEDGFVCALLDMYEGDSPYYLVTLDTDGSIIAYAPATDAPLSIHVCRQYVAVLTEKSLQLYNRKLELQNTADNGGWQKAFARSDGTAYGLTPQSAFLFIP